LEAFKVTGVVAKLNPDFYSIWNYRKDYLVSQIENPDL
jgi:singapore isolate B (sub-type 7) whole genome shotgun sequence assembly, scaffold_0